MEVYSAISGDTRRRQAVQEESNYQNATTAAEKKKCTKNVPYRARGALRDHCREEYEKNVTLKEFQDRMVQLKAPGKTFQELQEKMRQSTATATDDIVDAE
ncbi:hypothetical protein M7I_1239 [Glarea lozoyensis 74030]|uniref:Uncharacterized protein n=1 Tax=Glarea lozoyensis (strain ATCC 74030 / MF5533) TaxID=1104152 RepID=H0EFG5_GLAL7|nr:hypothetical protein M7I_1239 [Glarea lozoyensis 74030]